MMTVDLRLGDCLQVLPQLESGSVDVVITDPPYNVGKNYASHDDNMSWSDYHAWLREIYTECARVSRNSVVFFPGTKNVLDTAAVLVRTGLIAHRILGWHKKEYAGDKWIGGPANCWEPIVWAVKDGEKPVYNKLFGRLGRDFLVVSSTHGDPDIPAHPCPKPAPIMAWLVGLFVPPDGTCLDPFMGTGRTGVACAKYGRNFIGIEIDEGYFKIAERRIREAQSQMLLPLTF